MHAHASIHASVLVHSLSCVRDVQNLILVRTKQKQMTSSKGALPNILRATLEYLCLKYGAEQTDMKCSDLMAAYYNDSHDEDPPRQDEHQVVTNCEQALKPVPVTAPTPAKLPAALCKSTPQAKNTFKGSSWADLMSDDDDDGGDKLPDPVTFQII